MIVVLTLSTLAAATAAITTCPTGTLPVLIVDAPNHVDACTESEWALIQEALLLSNKDASLVTRRSLLRNNRGRKYCGYIHRSPCTTTNMAMAAAAPVFVDAPAESDNSDKNSTFAPVNQTLIDDETIDTDLTETPTMEPSSNNGSGSDDHGGDDVVLDTVPNQDVPLSLPVVDHNGDTTANGNDAPPPHGRRRVLLRLNDDDATVATTSRDELNQLLQPIQSQLAPSCRDAVARLERLAINCV